MKSRHITSILIVFASLPILADRASAANKNGNSSRSSGSVSRGSNVGSSRSSSGSRWTSQAKSMFKPQGSGNNPSGKSVTSPRSGGSSQKARTSSSKAKVIGNALTGRVGIGPVGGGHNNNGHQHQGPHGGSQHHDKGNHHEHHHHGHHHGHQGHHHGPFPPIYRRICIHRPVVIRPVVVGGPVIAASQPIVQEEARPSIPAGATIELTGQALGSMPGQVLLKVNGIELPASVVRWGEQAILITLPPVGLVAPVAAELVVVRADGRVDSTLPIDLLPAVQ